MKKANIQPYLFFGGRCGEALEFYRQALGAQVIFQMQFKDSPEPASPGMLPPGWENKIMHASFTIGETALMASDGCGAPQPFEGFSLHLSMPKEADAKQAFAALAENGEVQMPLQKTFWSPCFGKVTDRFGIGWMISVEA